MVIGFNTRINRMEWTRKQDKDGNVTHTATGHGNTNYIIARNRGERYWRWTYNHWLSQQPELTIKDAKGRCEWINGTAQKGVK